MGQCFEKDMDEPGPAFLIMPLVMHLKITLRMAAGLESSNYKRRLGAEVKGVAGNRDRGRGISSCVYRTQSLLIAMCFACE